MYAICQRSEQKLHQMGDAFGIGARYTKFEDVLADPKVDAIHINTPIPDHAPQSLAGLKAGKHVACTVPMATSIGECETLVETQRETGKLYMMMETVVYSREFLFVKQLYDSGELGRLQFLRGSHLQEMAGWPGYWEGLPPMHYATHCVSPCLCLPGKMADSVVCHGSGRISDTLKAKYGSPFAVETATFSMKDSDLAAEVTRSLFQTARQYIESFDVYAEKVSYEWPRIEHEPAVLHRGETPERVQVPDFADRLPEGIRPFTSKGVYDADETQHLSFIQGSGHGGSHPHLAHEFISAIVEQREPLPNAATSANWTMTGLCAHISAMKGGERIHIPQF
jgi:predicted dehydrogenase